MFLSSQSSVSVQGYEFLFPGIHVVVSYIDAVHIHLLSVDVFDIHRLLVFFSAGSLWTTQVL